MAEGAGRGAGGITKATGHRGKNIAVLVSGGNLDVNLLARIIERGNGPGMEGGCGCACGCRTIPVRSKD